MLRACLCWHSPPFWGPLRTSPRRETTTRTARGPIKSRRPPNCETIRGLIAGSDGRRRGLLQPSNQLGREDRGSVLDGRRDSDSDVDGEGQGKRARESPRGGKGRGEHASRCAYQRVRDTPSPWRSQASQRLHRLAHAQDKGLRGARRRGGKINRRIGQIRS